MQTYYILHVPYRSQTKSSLVWGIDTTFSRFWHKATEPNNVSIAAERFWRDPTKSLLSYCEGSWRERTNLDFGDHVKHLAGTRCFSGRRGPSVAYPGERRESHSLVVQSSSLSVGQETEKPFRIRTWQRRTDKRKSCFSFINWVISWWMLVVIKALTSL